MVLVPSQKRGGLRYPLAIVAAIRCTVLPSSEVSLTHGAK